MFRRILVPVDGSEQSLKGLKYAIHWAKDVHGGLTFLYVIDIKLLEGPLLRDVSSILGVTPWTNYQNQIHALLEERGKQILSLCETECHKNEISCEKVLKTGIISRTILEESELYDIIIIGKSGEHSRWSEGFLGGTTQAVIRRSKRPVIITNQSEFRRGPFILAYDGSPSAKVALRISTELAKKWNVTCHVVYV
ncbi:MAG: universal stress protein, partial [Candidatus Hydrogenedens sp.]